MSVYIPRELLIKILQKLPVKTLIRCTSVCKSWQSLIKSPTFKYSHLSNSENHAILQHFDLLKTRECYSLVKITAEGPFLVDLSSELGSPITSTTYSTFVGCCDGLVCLSEVLSTNCSNIIIWNPSVRNHMILPQPMINTEEPHICVLGFGVANHVYKVVRLVCHSKRTGVYGLICPPQAEIFSLSTGKWRNVGAAFDARLQVLAVPCRVSLEGVMHWLAYEPINNNSFRSSILTFEVGDEVFGEVMLPNELSRVAPSSLAPLDLAQDSLRLFVINGESLGVIEAGHSWCDVWVMKEYGVKESWTKLYRIDLVNKIEKVIAFCGEVLFVVQGLNLIAYNSETRRVKDLGICGLIDTFHIDNYMESLLLYRGYSGTAYLV